MSSLSEQMTILQKQQAILAEKIKQEEERKRKQQLTLQTLQKLNKQMKNAAIKTYKSKDGKYRGKLELQQTNLMTAPRFEVILEILKKQDQRIMELEAIITQQGLSSN